MILAPVEIRKWAVETALKWDEMQPMVTILDRAEELAYWVQHGRMKDMPRDKPAPST